MSNTYFASDEKNSKWTLDLLVRIGGGNGQAGPTSGIHWHMNINNKVSYIATDSARQSIPWVRSVGPDGKATVYQSTEQPLKPADVQESRMRRMDCIDCHNRPTHIYYPAARSVNNLMAVGRIDPVAAEREESRRVRAREPRTRPRARAADSIKTIINGYYSANYPAIAKDEEDANRADGLRGAGDLQPELLPLDAVSWKAFPDNIGHMYFLGCFRCHDGKHVSESGKVLTNDCNACHVVLAQETAAGHVARVARRASSSVIR